jgi:hypothetical protein
VAYAFTLHGGVAQPARPQRNDAGRFVKCHGNACEEICVARIFHPRCDARDTIAARNI